MPEIEDIPTDLTSRWKLPIDIRAMNSSMRSVGFRILAYGDNGVSWGRKNSSKSLFELALFVATPAKHATIWSSAAVSVVKVEHFRSVTEYEHLVGLPYHPDVRNDYSVLRSRDEGKTWCQAFVKASLSAIENLHLEKVGLLKGRTFQLVSQAEEILRTCSSLEDWNEASKEFEARSSETELKAVESALKSQTILKSWYGEHLARLVLLAAIVGSRIAHSKEDVYFKIVDGEMDTFSLIRILADRFMSRIWYIYCLDEGKYQARRFSNGSWEPIVLE